jgi:acetate kinase
MLEATGMPLKDVRAALEKKSGLLGISGLSGDMRDNWTATDSGNERARLALEIFARRVRKYLGAYLLEIGRCDAIIFTGGVGENAWRMRELITKDLGHLGIVMDEKKNSTMRAPACGMGLQKPESDVAILVIPTNEELAIARDTFRLVSDTASNPV